MYNFVSFMQGGVTVIVSAKRLPLLCLESVPLPCLGLSPLFRLKVILLLSGLPPAVGIGLLGAFAIN